MAQTIKIRRGDIVHILAGKDRGKEGRVLDARPRDGKLLVENLNLIKRHTRPRPLSNASRMGGQQMSEGGIISRPSPVPVSRVMLVCPTCKRPTRVGIEIREVSGEANKKVRVCKRADCGQDIDR